MSACVGADIQNKGYEKSKKHYQDNTYYVDVQDTNLNSNPHMDFNGDEFGFENEAKSEEAAEHLFV